MVTKIAGGLTGVIIARMLAIGGYDPTVTVQSASAITALKLLFSWLPCIFCAAGTLMLVFYKLDKIYPQIQKELTERRQNQVQQ